MPSFCSLSAPLPGTVAILRIIKPSWDIIGPLMIPAIEVIFPSSGKPGSFCTVTQVTETEVLLYKIPNFGYFLVTLF